MKKFLFLPLLLLMIVGCSVDNEDLSVPEIETQALELQVNSFSTAAVSMSAEYCGTATYPFGQYGDLEVKHDGFFLYITITAKEGYDIVDTKLDLESKEKGDGFPVVGNGNLPPGKMEHKFSFDSGTNSFSFPAFNIAGYLEGTLISIASKTTFTDGFNTFSSWTTVPESKKADSGNWSYLEYEIITCCEMAYAGKDFSRTMSQATYDRSINVAATLREYLLNQVYAENNVVKPELENNVEIKKAALSGNFDPTAKILDQTYNDWADGVIKADDLPYTEIALDGFWTLVLTTKYTVGEGPCADTANITLYIKSTRPVSST